MEKYLPLLSNFEAKFIEFLRTRNISRIALIQRKKEIKWFIRFLEVRYPTKQIDNYKQLFSHRVLKDFSDWLMKKINNQKRIESFSLILTQFRTYIRRQSTLFTTTPESSHHESLLDAYLLYLKQRDASERTIRNYRADLIHFLSYCNGKEDIPSSTEYKNHLQSLGKSDESIKRRLSAVSSFLKWANSGGKNLDIKSRHSERREVQDCTSRSRGISCQPTVLNESEFSLFNNLGRNEIAPLPSVGRDDIEPFKQNQQKTSFHIRSISNYINILVGIIVLASFSIGIYQQLFKNVKEPQAFPLQPIRTARILSFQGRLTDSNGDAVVGSQNIQFRFWDAPVGGLETYHSGICDINVDQSGVFSVILGSSCGKEIPSSVFTEYPSVYLGITVGSDQEMSPRRQIATVGYAINAETVQGIQPANPAMIGTIPFIDKNGSLAISAVSPIIRSTAGTFRLEGQSLVIATSQGSDGSIVLSPNALGTVQLNFTGAQPGSGSAFASISNPNIISGGLISGVGSLLTSGYNLLQLSSGSPQTTQFAVDAGGNTTILGNLTVGLSLLASSSGILANAPLVVNNLLYDGGLGIFGTKGNVLPTTFDFTKDITIEFDFKNGTTDVQADMNINTDGSKFYRFTWETSGKMAVQKCTPTCSELAQTTYSWSATSWRHGLISFSSGSIVWDMERNSARVNTKTSTDVSMLSSGKIQFTKGFETISNLRVSPNTNVILSARSAQVGGDLKVVGTIEAADVRIEDLVLGLTGSTATIATNDTNEDLTLNPNGSGTINLEGDTEIDASVTTYTQRLCHNGSDGATDDLKLGDCASAGQADYAEYYGSDGTLQAGDIVVMGSNSSIIQDPRLGSSSKAFVEKSIKPYQSTILGIVSTNPHPEILGEGVFRDEEHPMPIALVGRVPVHVSTINGKISVGDGIASSKLPGTGMKASRQGMIVGRALEDFDPANGKGKESACPVFNDTIVQCGTILAFVQYSWYDPIENGSYNGILSGIDQSAGKGSLIPETIWEIFHAKLLITNEFFTYVANISVAVIEELTADTIRVNNGIVSPVIDVERLNAKDITATGTAQFKEIKSENIESVNATFSGFLQAQDAQLDGDATIAGTLYADSIESKDLNDLKSSFGDVLAKIKEFEHQKTASSAVHLVSPPDGSLMDGPLKLTSTISETTNSVKQENIGVDSPGVEPGGRVLRGPSSEPAEPTQDSAYINAASPSSMIVSSSSGQLLSELNNQLFSSSSLYDRVSDFLASSSAFLATEPSIGQSYVEVPPNLQIQTLQVTGNSSLADTSISGSLFVDAGLFIENTRIRALGDTLFLSAQKAVDILGGSVIVDASGNLTVAGTLIAQGGIVTNEIQPSNGDLTINLQSNAGAGLPLPDVALAKSGDRSAQFDGSSRIGGFGKLLVKGENEEEVASIDPAGNATFSGTLSANKLSISENTEATASAVGKRTASEHFLERGINAPAEYTTASAGTSSLLFGSSELYIYNSTITDRSLIYITPTSDTQNRTLFVSSKIPGSHFVVSIDTPITTDVTFNWWILN